MRFFSDCHFSENGHAPCQIAAWTEMQEMSVITFPACHLAHVAGPERQSSTAIWICEYPYRTMRASGPSSDCGDCPIWQAMVRRRCADAATAAEQVEILEAMTAS